MIKTLQKKIIPTVVHLQISKHTHTKIIHKNKNLIKNKPNVINIVISSKMKLLLGN